MPISAIGNKVRGARGVTLMEMMVVLVIITLIVGVSVPSTLAGMETLRLSAATRSVSAFINAAANRAERHQQAMELSISVKENSVAMLSADGAYSKKLNLPQGIVVTAVFPALEVPTDETRQFLLQPGASSPRIGLEIGNHRGGRRIVRLNPVTGVTEIEKPQQP